MRIAAGFSTPDKESQHLKPWPEDVMRHTAVSHLFRQAGSYGLTAEWAGSTETIIKQHFQGRVSSTDTEAFYALLPKPSRPAA